MQRSVYELGLFTALREQLRCKEIRVEGADKWRNPETDLPADFETRRVEHYRSLAKPLDPVLNVLKEAALRVGLLEHFALAGCRESMNRDELAEKLILCIFGYGTNIGLRSIAGGEHGRAEDELRYVRRRYLSAAGARSFTAVIANATFTVRQVAIWGEGSSAVAIHSQRISCTASELAAMIEGAIRHSTDMQLEANYVDSHDHSEIGFGLDPRPRTDASVNGSVTEQGLV
ncbi:Tn3 transposase DDE domain-containing protein [Actinopolyspora lacussalsi subsp. righensis]|uniref:Tn3 transposase DDE domain-containing protein n=1 Tax=Actinopolyspora righensis TaxID=995060 RepID=A0A1I6X1P2_9ACTN|nr:Tn3 transposase DDE domain-containing protein [Actinopolyspora righensis]